MMKTIEILVHKYNIPTFEKRVAEINQKFEKHGYPYIEYKEISVDENHIHNFEVYSSFEQKNLIGEKVKFEGMVELINKEESSKLFHVSENIYNIISSENHVEYTFNGHLYLPETDNEILEKILNEIDNMSQEEMKKLEINAQEFLHKLNQGY